MAKKKTPTVEPKKYASGASGKHKNPRFPMSAPQEEIDSWDVAAAAEGKNRTAWLRALANAAVAKTRGKKT